MKMVSKFKPSGDQPFAIESLVKGLEDKKRNQVLLGVTGSGKTFTMANVINQTNRPALIMAHNKTLAAQLYEEMKEFFPNNKVEYFVSYYDYYQPEAYIARTDTFIEKDASINEQIDLLRHSATRSLIERRDVIVVASVSCIYGIGAPESYLQMTLKLKKHDNVSQEKILKKLVEMSYERTNKDFVRGTFRVRGDILDIFPSHSESAWRLSFFGNEIEEIYEFDALTAEIKQDLNEIVIFANSHYVTPRNILLDAVSTIKEELKERIKYFDSRDMLVESRRIEKRTMFDLEMIYESGTCKGIENYSRYLSGKKSGEPPPTLFDYLPEDAILFIDESHVTVPQVGAMYHGDKSRKTNLIDHGFRLCSAADNRPLKFEEWDKIRNSTIFVSATPGSFELEQTSGEVVEQVIRPTGLVDPENEIYPAETQVDSLIKECRDTINKGYRVLVTTLTKKMSENLSEYMLELGIKAVYLHSDIKTIERYEIIQDLRKGIHDVLVGINLLREGLDIPECGLVAILDADKEGFLRSETALIQTMGRAARNVDGRVIVYADKITKSLKKAMDESDRRRLKQQEYNRKHNITPESIKKVISLNLKKEISINEKDMSDSRNNFEIINKMSEKQFKSYISNLKKQMLGLAEQLEFEKAKKIQDLIKDIKSKRMI